MDYFAFMTHPVILTIFVVITLAATIYIYVKLQIPTWLTGVLAIFIGGVLFGILLLLTFPLRIFPSGGWLINLLLILAIIAANAYRLTQKRKITGKLFLPLQTSSSLSRSSFSIALNAITNLTKSEAEAMAEKLAKGGYYCQIDIRGSEKRARKICARWGIKLLYSNPSPEEYQQQLDEQKAREQAALESRRKELAKYVAIKSEALQILSAFRDEEKDGEKKYPAGLVTTAEDILWELTTTPKTVYELDIRFRDHSLNAAIKYLTQVIRIRQVSGTYFLPEDYENAIYPLTRMRYKQLRNQLAAISGIDQMNGAQFERFVAKLFTLMGYTAEVTKHSGDQGIDVIAQKSGTRTGIQAKRHAGKVGNSAVQEVVAGKAFYHLDKAIVITNSEFTQSAKDLAKATNVELWDRDLLKQKAAQYKI